MTVQLELTETTNLDPVLIKFIKKGESPKIYVKNKFLKKDLLITSYTQAN